MLGRAVAGQVPGHPRRALLPKTLTLNPETTRHFEALVVAKPLLLTLAGLSPRNGVPGCGLTTHSWHPLQGLSMPAVQRKIVPCR